MGTWHHATPILVQLFLQITKKIMIGPDASLMSAKHGRRMGAGLSPLDGTVVPYRSIRSASNDPAAPVQLQVHRERDRE